MNALTKTSVSAPAIRQQEELPGWVPGRSARLRVDFSVWKKLRPHPAYARNPVEPTAKGYRKSVNSGAMIEVVAAILDGRWYRLSGNGRTQLWESGELRLPEDMLLNVKVFQARSRRDLNQLFAIHSNVDAVKDRDYDRLFRVIQSENIGVRSKNLKFGFFTGSLNYAVRGLGSAQQPKDMDTLDAERAMTIYLDEIKQLDNLRIKAEVYSTGVLAAAMVSLARHPESIEVWKKLNDGTWTHSPGPKRYDAAGLIASFILQRRCKNKVTRAPAGHQFMFRLCLSVVELWAQKKADSPGSEPGFQHAPPLIKRPEDLIDEVRKMKGLGFEPALFQDPGKLRVTPEFHSFDSKIYHFRPTHEVNLDYYTGGKPPVPGRSEEDDLVARALSYANFGKDYVDSESYELDYSEMTKWFQEELAALAEIRPYGEFFSAGVLGAALLSMKIDRSMIDTWKRFNSGNWTRRSNGRFDEAGILSYFWMANRVEFEEGGKSWNNHAFSVVAMLVKSRLRLHKQGQEMAPKTIPRPLKDVSGLLEMTEEELV